MLFFFARPCRFTAQILRAIDSPVSLGGINAPWNGPMGAKKSMQLFAAVRVQ
jgi:hypothetical protein